MKRLLSIVLSTLLVAASVFAAIPLSAADSSFKVSCSPSTVTATAGWSEIIPVNIDISGNPGIWGARLFIVYPDGLTLDDGKGNADIVNSMTVFKGSDDMVAGIFDLSLSDPGQSDALKSIIRKQGIAVEGYRSATLYFESGDFSTTTSANGTLVTLNFKLTSEASAGDNLDIKLYYGDQDFMYASFDPSTGKIDFISYAPTVSGTTVNVTTCKHTSVYSDHKDPTCTATGYDQTICSDCNAVIHKTTINATGHTEYISSNVAPTCTDTGEKVYSCSVCYEVIRTEIISAPGHSNTTVTVEPTCTEAGVTKEVCSVCGEELILETTGALGHKYDIVIENPGQGDDESAYCVCSVCGESSPLVLGDANGDGEVKTADSLMAKRIAAGIDTPTALQEKALDVNGDEKINSADTNLISRFIAGIIIEF